ncbi:MAG: V-type ATPase subunit [Oscillospiraceae bacterium]|jgi:V/A-type H+-transporting ATPase subunit C|nr:V-type ATPase subunit [Oscillospiraceae bacterium]
MRDTDYAYAVARIRANESKLLTSSDIELLLSSKSAEDCIKRLIDKGYGNPAEGYKGDAKLLSGEREKAWSLAEEIVPDKAVLSSLMAANDFHNLKAVIKSLIADCGYDTLVMHPATISPEEIFAKVKAKDWGKLPDGMTEAAELSYTAFVEAQNSQLGEAIIDKASLESAIRRSKGAGELAERLAEQNAALTDIKIAYRCMKSGKSKDFMKQSLAECCTVSVDELITASLGGEDDFLRYVESTKYGGASDALRQGMSVFERWTDSKTVELISYAKHKPFSSDPIIAYLTAKETELRSVRIVLSGKRNGVDEERIRQRIRDLY